MMAPAHSDGPTGRFPTAATLEHLSVALGAYVRGTQTVEEERAVCDALADLAREAHERQLHGEQMLLAFKRVWQEMPEVAAMTDRRRQQRLLGHLVTLCIDVYYQRR